MIYVLSLGDTTCLLYWANPQKTRLARWVVGTPLSAIFAFPYDRPALYALAYSKIIFLMASLSVLQNFITTVPQNRLEFVRRLSLDFVLGENCGPRENKECERLFIAAAKTMPNLTDLHINVDVIQKLQEQDCGMSSKDSPHNYLKTLRPFQQLKLANVHVKVWFFAYRARCYWVTDPVIRSSIQYFHLESKALVLEIRTSLALGRYEARLETVITELIGPAHLAHRAQPHPNHDARGSALLTELFFWEWALSQSPLREIAARSRGWAYYQARTRSRAVEGGALDELNTW